MANVKLTKPLLEKMKPGEILRDATVRGLFAESGKTGVVSLKIQGDLRLGARNGAARKPTSIRMTLGRYPELGLDAARAQAMALLGQIKAGQDPRAQADTAASASAWTVERGFEAYVRDMSKRPGSERSQQDMQNRLERYLKDWRQLPLASLTKEMCEARQLKIQADIRARSLSKRATGARTANATIRDLSAVWNFAADYTQLPPVNPCRKIKMIGEVKAHHEIAMTELAAWWAAVGALKSPLRRAMHRLGLLSGLRPGNLMAIERQWIHLDAQRIVFPKRVMKGRRDFVLPLSNAMASLVRDALAAGDVLEPGSPFLFPTRGAGGAVQATVVSREKALKLRDKTGHALRHTWKTCARNARLPESQIELLLAHRLGGQRDTYGSLAEQFDRLLEDQESVSAYILARVHVPFAVERADPPTPANDNVPVAL